ncbi:MAG: hypothetical protein LBG46_06765 [Elusimicrobiota bacterium]|jgi:hypothetical protein|nr:hypothetical protein [Elusimicrobiota bacterium]
MKKFNKPDIKIIEQLAQELAIEPSFIEKDWYATRVLEVLKYLSDKDEKQISFALTLKNFKHISKSLL